MPVLSSCRSSISSLLPIWVMQRSPLAYPTARRSLSGLAAILSTGTNPGLPEGSALRVSRSEHGGASDQAAARKAPDVATALAGLLKTIDLAGVG